MTVKTKKTRRIKHSVKMILASVLGIIIGIVTVLGVNTTASETNINIASGTVDVSDYAYFKSTDVIKVTMPEGLLHLGYSSFEGCRNLKNVELPDGLTAIDNRAFAKCAITELTIPESTVYIGNAAFCDCEDLRSITLPSNMLRIENNMFYRCKSLKDVTIPTGVTTIGQQSFFKCEELRNLELPDSVISIEDGAFYDCTNLSTLFIPDSVTFIGKDAFEGCVSLNLKYNPGSYAEKYAIENGFAKAEVVSNLDSEKTFKISNDTSSLKSVEKNNDVKASNADKDTKASQEVKDVKLLDVPKTGVETPYLLMMIMALMSLAGMIVVRRDDCIYYIKS